MTHNFKEGIYYQAFAKCVDRILQGNCLCKSKQLSEHFQGAIRIDSIDVMMLEIIKKSQCKHECAFESEIWGLLASTNGYLRQSAARTLSVIKEPSNLYAEIISKFDNDQHANVIHGILVIMMDISKESLNIFDREFLLKIQNNPHSRIDLLKNIINQISEKRHVEEI